MKQLLRLIYMKRETLERILLKTEFTLQLFRKYCTLSRYSYADPYIMPRTHCSHNPRLDYLRHIFFELTSHELDLVLLAWLFATVSLIKEIIRAERNWAAQTPAAPFEYVRHSLRQSLSLSLSLRHA